ncbi:MAG: tetratricopeptide repeat protein, partial [Sedimentisphaerales bacterium]
GVTYDLSSQACCGGAIQTKGGCMDCINNAWVSTCDSSQCQTCVGGQCKVCGGDANQACCNGTCYDISTQGCCYGELYSFNDCKYCDDEAEAPLSTCDPSQCETCDGNGSCVVCGNDPNQFCCNGECYENDDDDSEMLLQTGRLTFNQGKWQESISYFERAMTKFPAGSKPPDALYALARMYEETGDISKAMDTYGQLLTLLEDGSPVIQKVKTRIISFQEESGN